MIRIAQSRIGTRTGRAGGFKPAVHRRSVPKQDDLQCLIVRMAEESERGTPLLARAAAAGVYGPDEDDPWLAPPERR